MDGESSYDEEIKKRNLHYTYIYNNLARAMKFELHILELISQT